MQALLEKLTQDFSSSSSNSSSSSSSSGSSEGENAGSDGEEGLDAELLSKLMNELPSLAQSLHASGKGSEKGGEGTPEGLAGGGPSLPKGLQAMAERLLNESGEDGGLLQQFRALQAATSGGPTDLDGLTSAFKGLSEALKGQGTDISSLMSSILDDPLVQLPPVSPPPGLKKIYKRGLPRLFGDRQGTDIQRPPAVSLSVIQSSLATTSQALPPIEDGGGPPCHALVLSGALARAPLQAGAILGLVEQYKARRQTLRWDVVAGVNKAALSAVISLAFPPGENNELEFALYLWDFWLRMKSENFLKCPQGLKDLMDLSKILSWLSDSSEAVEAHGRDPATLPLPHLCDASVFAETAAELLQQLPHPEETAAAAAAAAAAGEKIEASRIAVVTAAVVGGGQGVWELRSIGREDTCIEPRPSVSFVSSNKSVCLPEEMPFPNATAASNPKSELDLTLAALLATNATPGVYPIVRARTMGGPSRGGPRLTGGAPPSLLRKERVAFADGRLVADLSVDEAIQACIRRVAAEGDTSLKRKEILKGQGIILDIIGTAPFDESEVDEQLIAIAAKLRITPSSSSSSNSSSSSSSKSSRSSRSSRKGAMSPKALLKKILKHYPLLQVRHVVFPEEAFELMSEYADFRGTEALMHHGRLMGWKALTLEDID
ncbi:hypothetical protein Emag_007829 [Eimeria magna]